jgi:hypothetical protein
MKRDNELLTDENSMIIIRWPDGTECLLEDLHEMSHMSDDYERVRVPFDYDF